MFKVPVKLNFNISFTYRFSSYIYIYILNIPSNIPNIVNTEPSSAGRTEFYNISDNIDDLEHWYNDRELAEHPKQQTLRQQQATILKTVFEDDNIADEQE